MRNCSEHGISWKFRLILSALMFCLLFSGLLPETMLFSPRSARAEDPEEWDDLEEWEGAPEDPDFDPYDYDLETIPFRLVNAEGKEPGIDRESEWMLVLKPEWPEQDLPQHVTSVTMNLYCDRMDWNDSWSHIWKTELQGLPEVLPCTGLKVAGRYMLTATVHYDHEDTTNVSVGFVIDGAGREQIDRVIEQAAEECRAAGDEWQTALNLYQWLLDRMVYDDTLSYYSSDAILRGTGVCDSYARLYFLLCREAGLSAYVVYGETQRGYHAWDAVQIDGRWYYSDPTWDDHPVNDPAMDYSRPASDENGIPYGVSEYRYFMISRDLMVISGHTSFEWLDEGKLACPEQPADSLDAGYYVHTGRCEQWGADNGNGFRTIREMILDALVSGEKFWSSLSLSGVPLSARGFSDTPFLITDSETALLSRYLQGASLDLPDGTTVEVETYLYEAPDMSGRVLNVYPAGAPETDEPLKYELDENLKHIEAGAYEGDPHCGEVICPAGLESIGSRAFADCKRLWCIRIPSGVQSIAEDAFAGCGEFCIWTEHRDSEPARYATQHDITLFVDDEEKDSNG